MHFETKIPGNTYFRVGFILLVIFLQRRLDTVVMRLYLFLLNFIALSSVIYGYERTEVRLRLAQNALRLGMPLLAEQMTAEGIFDKFEKMQRARQLLANTHIAQQQWDQAEVHLSFIADIHNNANASLSLAILQLCKGQKTLIPFVILRWSENSFDNDMLPWYLFLRGNLLKTFSHLKACDAFFKAQTLLDPEVAQLLGISFGLPSISLLQFFDHTLPSTIHFQFIREYVLGIKDASQALTFLDEKGQTLEYKNADSKAKFLLLKALIELQVPKPTIDTVCEILSMETASTQSKKLALKILSNDEKFWGNPTYFNKLETFFKSQSTSALVESFWLIKGKFLLLNGQYDDAQAFMAAQWQSFSFPTLKAQMLHLMACSAFLKNPAAYRLAADYIKEAAILAPELCPTVLAIHMRADLAFLAKDYEHAKTLYREILEHKALDLSLDDVAYQWILSSILQENLEETKLNLSKAIENRWLSEEKKWQIQFTLLEFLKKHSCVEALEYANVLSVNPLSEEQKRLLSYVKIELYLSQDKPQNALEELNKLQPFSQDFMAFWLKGKTLAQLNEYGLACEQFEALRKLPITDTFYYVLSYIEETNLLTTQKAYAQAQQLLSEMADKFPEHAYAPTGLYLAATNAEQRGLLYANETVQLLNKLIERYPSHELVYFAKLKQGHLLMALNNFLGARKIFAQLQHDFPAHAQNTYCKYLEIKCQIAQSTDSSGSNMRALEMLLAYPNMPLDLKLEIVYQLALLRGDQKQYSEAKKLLWEHVDPLLHDSLVIGTKIAYWLSRCLFQLAEYSEKENAAREARKIYQLILSHNLPGSRTAEQKLNY